MRNYLSNFVKQISPQNFVKLNKLKNKKMESKLKVNESDIFLSNHNTLSPKNTFNMETNDVKFPTFDDPMIEEHLKKDVTYESLLSDIRNIDEGLNNFSLAYDSLFSSNNGTIIKKQFLDHNLNYATYKIYSHFLTRQITLIYSLLQKKFLHNFEDLEKVSNYLKKNYLDLDPDTLIHDYFLNNNKYFMISRENDNPEEYDRHLQMIKIIKGLIKMEKDILLFDLEDENYLPSISSISISLIILKSVLDALTLQVIELRNLKEIKEDFIINFFHNCNKLELFTSYMILSYKIPHDDIFNLPENSEVWVKFKNHYERRVIYSRHVLKKKLQQVFDMIILGNASVSKGHNQFDSKYLRILGSGWYMAYFFFNKKQASLQSIKFSINPNFEIAQKIWNMLDSKGIKNLLKLTLPRIKYSKRWYLKKTEKEINLDEIKSLNEKCKNFEPYSSNNSEDTNQQETINRNSINDNIDNLIVRKIDPENSNNYVKIRIISHKEFYVPSEKTFMSNFFGCCSVEKNFYRDSLIIHIHGGGFIAMSASSHENYTRKWAEKLGVPIFSIDYRLAPEYPYPNALDDVYQAYMWIINYAEHILNLNVKNIILTGDSAGGNLATALTYLLILKNKRLPTALFLTYPGLRVTSNELSISFFNVLNDQIIPYHLLKYCLESYRKDYENEKDPFLSPLLMNEKILSFLPPVRIICGSSDPLRDDSVLFTKKLSDLNKDVKLIELKYFPHGFLNYDFPLMMPEASVGSEIIMEEMEKFINK